MGCRVPPLSTLLSPLLLPISVVLFGLHKMVVEQVTHTIIDMFFWLRRVSTALRGIDYRTWCHCLVLQENRRSDLYTVIGRLESIDEQGVGQLLDSSVFGPIKLHTVFADAVAAQLRPSCSDASIHGQVL